MRNPFILIATVLLLPASIAAAGQTGMAKPEDRGVSGRLLPVRGPRSERSCAAYGPGFVKLEGTETCVKIGGAVRLGVGGAITGAER